VHRGSLMLGTIGEHERMDGTVIADAVNVASRVEGLTKYFGARVMVTDDVRAALAATSDYEMRYLGRIAVKGRGAGVGMHEVIDGDTPARLAAKHTTAAAFDAAVSAFAAGSFDDASSRRATASTAQQNSCRSPRASNHAWERRSRTAKSRGDE
jgi:hypothetical protein